MSIQFSGISSGLPVNDIITQLIAVERQPLDLLLQRKNTIATQQSQYAAVSSRSSALLSSINKLTDAKLGSTFDLFQSKKPVSSDETVATATATNDAVLGAFNLEVVRLATATKAASTTPVGNYTTGTSLASTVAQGTLTSGDFTVFVNNQAQTITVNKDTDTVQSILDQVATKIATVTGAAASGTVTADGKVQFTYQAGTSIRFGATGDTTNFNQVMHLNSGTTNGPNDTFTAGYGTSTLNLGGKLIGNQVGFQTNTITAGTIKIGGGTFTINADTTLSSLMSKVNSSSDAGVLMTYNKNNNAIELVSKKTGNQAITLDDGGTGFLSSIKLISGSDSLSSQTLGLNAQIKINSGGVIESASNTVDAAVSGMTGVTLNLKKVTSGTPISIDIQQDTDKLKTAVNDFIGKFNTLISYIDEQTKKDAILNGESTLTRFRSDLRKQISDAVSSSLSDYTTLSEIGISTGAVNTSPGTAASPTTFSLNETTFLAKLASDPDSVKKLMVGDGTTDGILSTLEKMVKGAQDPEYGLFSARDKSANAQKKSIDEAIAKGEKRLEVREKQLRAQFIAMESLIAQYKNQQNSLAAIGANLGR